MGGFNGISFLINATTKILRPHVLEAFAVIHIRRLCNTIIGSSIVDALLALELCALLNIVVSVLLRVILCQLLTYDHVPLRALIVVVADPLRFCSQELLAHGVCYVEIYRVVVISDKLRDGISHIIHHGELNQQRDQIQEGVVPWLVIPGQDREGALWLKHVRGR